MAKGNKEQKTAEIQSMDNTDDMELDESQLEDALENVPPEHKKIIERYMISSSVQMRNIASPETAVMKKITSEHISKYLDGAEQEMKNSYAEKLHSKIFAFSITLIGMIFFLVLVVLLKDTPDVMEKVLYVAGGFLAGVFGGYGFGKNKSSD